LWLGVGQYGYGQRFLLLVVILVLLVLGGLDVALPALVLCFLGRVSLVRVLFLGRQFSLLGLGIVRSVREIGRAFHAARLFVAEQVFRLGQQPGQLLAEVILFLFHRPDIVLGAFLQLLAKLLLANAQPF